MACLSIKRIFSISIFVEIFYLTLAGLSISNNAFIRDASTEYQISGSSLSLQYLQRYTGQTIIGSYEGNIRGYAVSGHSEVKIALESQYYELADNVSAQIFRQTFPNGLTNTSTGERDGLITGWPCFKKESESKLGFWSLGDYMFGWMNQQFGKWNEDTMKISTGLKSGPLMILDDVANVTTIYSRFEEFLATHMAWHASRTDNGTSESSELCYGIMGNISEVPEHYSVSFIQVDIHGLLSPRKAFQKWGEIMTTYYGKTNSAMQTDLSVNYLGYYTDNGAYYYYSPEVNKTYEQTIYDVIDHADEVGLPIKYIQYDSWFYPKDTQNDAVTQWVATKETFPDNLTAVFNRTKLPVVAHNRYFSPYNVYAKQNGGSFEFIVEEDIAIPADARLWQFLFQQSKVWGLNTYEQDWQNRILEECVATTSTLSAASDMFYQMGEAADQSGIYIQYCMSPPKSALQSLLSNAVSQGRVSDDYQPGNEQWKIGETSMFAWAMNLAPFKDTFWTTTSQPGNPYNLSEPYPKLEAMVALLSAGPFATSDKIGCESLSLIASATNKDGLILKPDQPAFAIDRQILQQTGLISDGPHGQVWTTFSKTGSLTYGIIFATDLKKSFKMTMDDLGFNPGLNSVVYVSEVGWYKTLTYPNGTFILENCTKEEPCLKYTSPRLQRQGVDAKGKTLPAVYVLGELGKWAPMSSKRVERISVTYDDVIIDLKGAANEYVSITFLLDEGDYSELYYTMIGCILDQSGRTTMTLKKISCSNETESFSRTFKHSEKRVS